MSEPKRGRPRSTEIRSKVIVIRLAPKEHARIKSAAARDQRPTSQWARIVMLDAAGE